MPDAVERLQEAGLRRFRRYPEYRDSGIPWLGSIPSHWQVNRLKTLAAVQLSNVDKKSVGNQKAVLLCNYVDVYRNERITPDLEFMKATATHEQIRRFTLREGDVLITKDSEAWNDIAVPAVVVQDLPGVLCGYHLAHIRPSRSLDGGFLTRVFSALGPRHQFHLAANGITRFGLTGDAIRSATLVIPPLGEQHAIRAFLDRETAKIDRLVARKERLIELLQQKRNALLTRAVIGGLATADEIRGAGSPAFPVVPGDWTTWKMRRLIRQIKRPVAVRPDRQYREIGIRSWGKGIFHKNPVSGSLIGEKSVFRVEPGDLVLNIVFAWEGAVAVASQREAGMIASHRFPTFRPSEQVDLDYLYMLFQSQHGRSLMDLNSPGAAGRNKTLRIGQFLDEGVPLPTLELQRAIVAAYRSEEKLIAELGGKVRDAIDLLKEFRSALISAAVTGKIDVREEAR